MGFKSLDGQVRPATWHDRDRAALLKQQGVTDVYLEPEQAPPEFWHMVDIATEEFLLGAGATNAWAHWVREVRFATGWPPFGVHGYVAYKSILDAGGFKAQNPRGWIDVGPSGRLTAVEILMDGLASDVQGLEDFRSAVNDKAQWLKVGVRLDGNRFTPLSSEHMHESVVQPALMLLRDPSMAAVDGLYRKAFERVFAHDYPGAITVTVSAVEEMLRTGLGESGGQLKSLLGKARAAGWVSPSVEQFAVKLQALRQDSDAHTLGTEDRAVAMLAVHITGSLLVHLAEVLPASNPSGH